MQEPNSKLTIEDPPVRTFCRVCEPACGLVAHVENGRLTKLSPDREHPVTEGFACHKGIAGAAIHNDPDRVNHPLARTGDGFETVAWDAALSDIGERLREIVGQSGAQVVSAYTGNPSGFNVLARPAASRFFRRLGVVDEFGSGTQDCANKFAGSEAVFGSRTIHPIPDLERTDFLLILGENPAVSHMSFLGIADPMKVLRRARKRGAEIWFVDPRRNESVVPSVGDVLQIRPDTDLYLLAAMICEVDRAGLLDRDVLARRGRDVEGLLEFVGKYPAERVADIVGVPAEQIASLARAFASAESASVHMSRGVNMGRQGTLCYWLVHMLSFVTGNLDRRGGNVLSEGFYFNAKSGRADFSETFKETPWGSLRAGQLPGNLMARAIRERGIRALFVLAGNPVLSIAGEQEIRDALAGLDLLVCIDIYRNATGELADYVLPAVDMYEREDLNLNGLGLQHRPWVQYTDRVVEPRFERKEEWWMFARLEQEMGFPSILDLESEEERHQQLWGKFDHMLRSRGHSFDELRASPTGIQFGDHEPGQFYERHLQTEDSKVDCCPAAFTSALERAEDLFVDSLERLGDELLLITRRDKYMHNSWYANVEIMKPEGWNRTFVYVHPQDAERLQLVEGEQAKIGNSNGELTAEVKLDADLRPGVVAIPHGWGNARTPGMRLAQATAGENVNRVLPSGLGSFEPLSSQAHMTGIPVTVAPAARTASAEAREVNDASEEIAETMS